MGASMHSLDVQRLNIYLYIYISIHIYIYIYVTNLGACLGTQIPTDLLKDPFLSSVCVCVCVQVVCGQGVCV